MLDSAMMLTVLSNYRKPATVLLTLVLSMSASIAAQAQDLWDLYQVAQRKNSNWAGQQYDYLANQQNENLALSELLPQVGLQGKVQYDHFDPTHDTGNPLTTPTNPNNPPSSAIQFSSAADSVMQQLGVGLRQPLFRLDRWKNYEKAKIASGINDIQLLQQHQAFTEQLIKSYLAVLQAQAMTESLNAEYTALKAQDNMMQARLAQGVVARVDTEETRASLENVRALLANNDVAILNAKQQLSLLTGQPIEQLDTLKQPFHTDLVTANSIDDWLAKAQSNNLDIQLTQANVLLAKKQQQLLHANRYPQLDLVGNVGYQKKDTEDDDAISSMSNGTNYSVGIELNVPLYTGGRINRSEQQAAYQTDAAIQRAAFAQHTVITQTSQAYLNLMAQKATIAARHTAVEANAKVEQASKVGYDLGVRSMVDTLLAQRQYYAAKRDLITAYFNYLTAYVDLQKATGNLSNETVKAIDNLLQPS